MKKSKNSLAILGLLLFTFIPSVKADIGSITIASTTLEAGETKTLNIGLPSNIQSTDGYITSNDPSCVKVLNVTSQNGSGNYFMAIDLTGNALKNAGTVTIKGLKNCETILTISEANLVTTSEIEGTTHYFTSGKIKVNGPVEETKTEVIEEKKEEVNSQVKEETQVINENTNTVEENSSSESSTSQSNDNSTNVAVETKNEIKSEEYKNNNSSQTNKKDNNKTKVNNEIIAISNKSNNNKLDSLSVDGYDIKFSSDTLEYSISVSNDVGTIDVTYKASDNNASVSLQGNKDLKVGENTVSVTVTAEDGSKRTYIINVFKASDPSKVYDTDNNLLSITPSIGTLSPKFSKDTLNYIIYLPFEEETVTFETVLSNADKASVEIIGPANLVVGDNKYILKVRAESGDIKEYTIIVRRANIFSTSDNNYLKSIVLENGELIIDNKSVSFDKNISTYYYKSGENFSYKFLVEDNNATTKVFENDKTITIVVTSANGETRVYTLIPYKSNTIKYIILVVIGIIIGYLLRVLYFQIKKSNKKKKLVNEE
ncbi:MAG: cadherin-like beta sandwich domain-containing protein [Bacilli bacterium]|nr:cadherin-like beta sandwich domain-containing protein [Bacilli bacterium]